MAIHRRELLKATAAGATGLILGAKATRAFGAWPKAGAITINPNISNMRVVGCVDPAMMNNKPSSMAFSTQNAAVNSARVAANMDAMAMALANKSTADEAWCAVFRSSKPWDSTVVAIKVNVAETKNMARIAVIEKFVTVFRKLGVPAANIIIYDGCAAFGSPISNYKQYFSISETSKIQAVISNINSALGGTVSAPLPDGTSAKCTANIANGTVDILINLANNKGHMQFGGSTLCLKNHYGTFYPDHSGNLANNILRVNKADAVLGGSPARQQLCFVDSLFANKSSNVGTPEVMPNYLIMGTFASAVDYLAVKKVREAVMKCSHDSAIVNSFMTSFGYTTSDPEWVQVSPASDIVIDGGSDAPVVKDGGSETPVRDAGSNAPVRDAGAAEVPVRDGGAGVSVRDAGAGAGGETGGGSTDAGAGGGRPDPNGANDDSSGGGCASAGGGDLGAGILAGGVMAIATARRLLTRRETLVERPSTGLEEEETHEHGK